MITEKQKTIAEQAIYGDLKVMRKAWDSDKEKYIFEEWTSEEVMEHLSFKHLLDCKPILRPLDLTKEITHKGYNENQPFIPLVELAKVNTSNNLNEYKIPSKKYIKKGFYCKWCKKNSFINPHEVK